VTDLTTDYCYRIRLSESNVENWELGPITLLKFDDAKLRCKRFDSSSQEMSESDNEEDINRKFIIFENKGPQNMSFVYQSNVSVIKSKWHSWGLILSRPMIKQSNNIVVKKLII
jgi:hypothetical protein